MDLSTLSLREKVAQTAIILHNKDRFVDEPVGGVFIGAQIITEVEDGVAAMRETVTKYRDNMAVRPLVMSDFENGCGMMIKGLTPFPYMMSLGCANDVELAYEYGKATAMEAKTTGANTTFSPVCDLNLNWRNPLVNVRGISDDVDRAVPLLRAVIRGMQDNGLGACAKHFPGDGVDWRDQHLITTVNSLPMDRWWETYGRVFGEMINEGVSMIMPGHIALPAYTGNNMPATLSKELMTDLLKGEMGFKGVIVSDATNMGGFSGYFETKTEAEVACFAAGCDLILWPTDEYIDAVTDALEKGEIPMARLEDAIARIQAIKDTYIPADDTYPELTVKEKAYVKDVGRRVGEQSITLVKNEKGLLPLREKPKKVLLCSTCNHAQSFPAAERLCRELEARGAQVTHLQALPIQSKLPKLAEFEKMAGEADLIVYAYYSRSFRPVGPVDFTGDRTWFITNGWKVPQDKAVYVSFGSPYFVHQYFERSAQVVNAYSMMEDSAAGFVRALYGETPFTEDSPVNIELT